MEHKHSEKINLQQDTQEWLDFRRNKIGASDAPIIMEKSPWKTPYQLWKDKLQPPEYRSSPAMERGKALEPIARLCFNMDTCLMVEPEVHVSIDKPWMMASFDGVTRDGKTFVEIKCPGGQDHLLAMDGIIPEKYIPQLQHQFAVLGCERGYYFSYHPELGARAIPCHRDDDFIKKLIKKEEEFYQCFLDFIPPKMSPRDFNERNDNQWNQLATQYLECRSSLKHLEAQEAYLKKQLIELAGQSNSMGAGIKLSKVVRKGTIDYNLIPGIQGANLEKYRKPPIESWLITSQA